MIVMPIRTTIFAPGERYHPHLFMIALVLFAFLAPIGTLAATDVTSDITTDTHWTLDGSPYVVDATTSLYPLHSLTINAGITLTIDPGVVVKFRDLNGLFVNGALFARGTEDHPIIFTSFQDDSADGDTNGDSDATTPTDENWMHIEFESGSTGVFDHAFVRYGGETLRPVPMTGIENYGGTVTIDHTTLTHNGYDGFGQYGGHTTLQNSDISDHNVGISIGGGTLEASNIHIHDNTNAGIDHSGGALTVHRGELDNDNTGVRIDINDTGTVSIDGSSIHDNPFGGIDNESAIIDYDANDNPVTMGWGVTPDARSDWWGSASGPYEGTTNPSGAGDEVSDGVIYAPWLTSDPLALPPADPCVAAHSCVSNVLFLPGIEGSRLYEGVGCGKSAEEKLWEPYDGIWNAIRGVGDKKINDLALDPTGESACSDIYAKDDDILDSTAAGNIYASFISEMNNLKSAKTINDWKPVAYDWRLSLPDLLTKGAEHDDKIYYEQATSTPYIEQTLRALAASSKTGKVTIVAHSNGGLIAKALMERLGDAEAANLIDRVIMVAAPQSGAPYGIGALLVGYDTGINSHGITIISNEAVRAFAQNSPMAYHLLPSQSYFDSVMYDPSHPVASFSGSTYAKEEAAYGNVIGTEKELDDFLLAKEGGRTQASDNDLDSLKILNPSLISYATSTHDVLDRGTHPPGIKIDQIAGWGVNTVAGIGFYSESTLFGSKRMYRPVMIEDGDGTVPIPSALMMATSTDVNDYWVNLLAYDSETHSSSKHPDLFEVSVLRDLIKNLLENHNSPLPSYIQTSQPFSNSAIKKLVYILHSPLTLELADASGNVTGLHTDGSVTEDIPGSTYGEFGEVKYVIAPEGSGYTLTMRGQASGAFSLDAQEIQGGSIIASSTVAGVPTTANTTATILVSPDTPVISPLAVDEDGDGNVDATVVPKAGETTIFDTTPPEFKLTFATSTNSLTLVAADDMGAVTTKTATIYPPLKKNQKTPQGVATTTLLATDTAGNTTALVYTEKLPSPDRRDTIQLESIAYNGATTMLKSSSVSYKWRLDKGGKYQLFASYLKTASTTLESHYRPKKNKTVIMTRPQDLDDSDSDDDSDMRPTRETLPGMVIPYITTKNGSLIIGY